MFCIYRICSVRVLYVSASGLRAIGTTAGARVPTARDDFPSLGKAAPPALSRLDRKPLFAHCENFIISRT